MKKESSGDKREKVWYAEALHLFVRLSAWVALPVIMAAFLGKWLDSVFGTKPWLLVACVLIAFNVTMIALVKETNKTFKQIEKDSGESKSGNKDSFVIKKEDTRNKDTNKSE